MSIRNLKIVVAALALSGTQAFAVDATGAIEQALDASQKSKRGVVLLVNGATLGGGVVKIEPGQWVEIKNQDFSSIIVRIDKIDAVSSR